MSTIRPPSSDFNLLRDNALPFKLNGFVSDCVEGLLIRKDLMAQKVTFYK